MTLEFWLDAADRPAQTVEYLPWGTRSLKLLVRTNSLLPPLRLRPHNIRPADTADQIFRAFEDSTAGYNNSHFLISWGGGHEEGPCTKSKDFLKAFERCVEMAPGDQQYIYFNLTHISTELPSAAAVTFQAITDAGDEFASLTVNVQRPAKFAADAIHIAAVTPERWEPTPGAHLPSYDPRWWPLDTITYEPATPPPLAVVRKAGALDVLWAGKTVGRITDRSEPTILEKDGVRVDLFKFGADYYALRIWFFWLDAKIGSSFFVGRHEVPDVERFDFLLRLRDGLVMLACADMHWRELWGLATESPQLATIGLGQEAKALLAQELWEKLRGGEKPEHQSVYKPLPFVTKLATAEAQRENPLIVRKKGTEAHLPILLNLDRGDSKRSELLTSSDVRLG